MYNIVFSTTRQWNPGDEFILLGCINILKKTIGDFNPIIYNRNPEIQPRYRKLDKYRTLEYTNKFSNKMTGLKQKIQSIIRIGFLDNSFKEDLDWSCVDLVVFAGSPEWIGDICLPLYRTIKKYNIPSIYLGIGSGNTISLNSFDTIYKDVISHARLITVRDSYTFELLKDYGANRIPCPALLSSSMEKVVNKVNKIGLVFSTKNAVMFNRISEETYNYQMKLYKEIIKFCKGNDIETELICHYIDEVPEAHELFPKMKINYSYDSKDYINIFNRFDLVIGPRVHAIGLSASLGIPGIMISHDLRGETVKGFMAEIINEKTDVNKVIELINDMKETIEERSKKIVEHKKVTMEKYVELMNEKF